MQNMRKACSSHCHLYGIKTSHFIFDACSGRQGAFPVQDAVKKTQSERNGKKLLEM